MAVDSEDKRRSVQDVNPVATPPLTPADRRQVQGLYSGVFSQTGGGGNKPTQATLSRAGVSRGTLRRASPVAQSTIAPPPPTSTAIPLSFDEPADRPSGAILWPVTVGVPFANGQLTDTSMLSIGGTSAVPAQFTPAINWRHGAGTLSWVHCDFQATFGGGSEPAANLETNRSNPAPTQSVSVVDSGTAYVVSTGAVTFTCNKTAFNLFDSLSAGSEQIVSSSSLYWKDTLGNLYEGKYEVDAVTVEKSGPMRAVLRYDGWYKTSAGTKKMRYKVWVHAFAGLPYVRIYDKFIWTENTCLLVNITANSSVLTTVCRSGADNLNHDGSPAPSTIQHGWSTGNPVSFAYSHSDKAADGTTQNYDNTSAQGNAMVTIPTVTGTVLDRVTTYYVRALSTTTLSLHRSLSDAQNNLNPIVFTSIGHTIIGGTDYGGRHYLQAQTPVLAEWGMKFNLAKPVVVANCDIDSTLAAYNPATNGTVTILQGAHGSASATPTSGSPVSGSAVAGWAEAKFADGAGLAVSVKGLNVQIPKALSIDGTSLSIKLWGGSPMSLREEDRINGAPSGYQKEWLQFSGESNAFGISKTHEVWVWPSQNISNNRLINDLVQRPAACCPDPVSACATDYLQSLRPAILTPTHYQYVEDAFENALRYLTNRTMTVGDYDEWNFGDVHLFDSGTFRFWDAGGYNVSDLFWWQWYRTGNRFYLEEGINNARHVSDVNTAAHSQVVSGPDTFCRIAGRTENFCILQWGWPAPYMDAFVDHPWFMLLCWLMTGYEPIADVLTIKAAATKNVGGSYGDPSGTTPGGSFTTQIGSGPGYDLTSTSREEYGRAYPKMCYYEFTGDNGFYLSGRNWLQLFIIAQNAHLETLSDGTGLFPNNNYQGFFYEAFRYAYRHGGESSVLAALAQLVNDFAPTGVNSYTCSNLNASNPPGRSGRTNCDVKYIAAYEQAVASPVTKPSAMQFLQEPALHTLRETLAEQNVGTTYLGYQNWTTTTANILRNGLQIWGVLSDLGFPAISWPGNLASFGSATIANAPFVSQLVFWLNVTDTSADRHLLVALKDGNFSDKHIENPGRIQAIVTGPDDSITTTVLTTDASYQVNVSGSSLANVPNIDKGTPVRFSTTGTLPTPLSASTTYYLNGQNVFATFAQAVQNSSPLSLSGGTGTLSLLAVSLPHDVTVTIPQGSPPGIYRVNLQSEAQLFWGIPSSDATGMVVDLPWPCDLLPAGILGASEYNLQLLPGQSSVTMTLPLGQASVALPLGVADANYTKLGCFGYDGISNNLDTHTATFSVPSPGMFKLFNGYSEFTPQAVNSLPVVRLTNTSRHAATVPGQWFSPLADINAATSAFWPMQETSGTRFDAIGSRHLSEVNGPITFNAGGRVGNAVQFVGGSQWLSVADSLFAADGSFTWWGWVRVDNWSNWRMLVSKGAGDFIINPTQCEWAVWSTGSGSAGTLSFQVTAGGTSFTMAGPAINRDSQSHFVMAWYDKPNNTIGLQVDNGAASTHSLASPIAVGSNPFNIGGSTTYGTGGGLRGWLGLVNASGFAKSLLTQHQRTLLYNGGFGLQYPF